MSGQGGHGVVVAAGLHGLGGRGGRSQGGCGVAAEVGEAHSREDKPGADDNSHGGPRPRLRCGRIVRVGRETKGRKGKGVTVISGLPLAGAELGARATKLKQRCGCGGTVDGALIEIQGDHRDLLVEELGKLGYKARRSGG